MYTRTKIKDIPSIERPREKLIRYGPEKLSSSELLAVILGSGVKGQNAVTLANKILKKFNSNLPQSAYKELKQFPGLGPAKSSQIIASFELSRRLIHGKKSKIYLKPKDIWQELKDIRDNKKEHFVVFYLDNRNQEIKREIISIGCLDRNLVHPREVFEPAVRNLAAHIIIAHNHPSGSLEPSREDIELTKRLVKAGEILGIEITDHVIVSKGNFISLREKGFLCAS